MMNMKTVLYLIVVITLMVIYCNATIPSGPRSPADPNDATVGDTLHVRSFYPNLLIGLVSGAILVV